MTTYTQPIHHRWPEGAIVYHIYPRSFQDSNGDGIGDLPGIIQRLDYLQGLGIHAIWLSPFYPSPMADFGYDVADYCAVDPLFGTLGDFKLLLTQAAKRDIKVIIDLVPNHTSDQHDWFQQSRQDATDPYADWYIWKDAKAYTADGAPLPPNNWRDALTGGSAWEWDTSRDQFYLHSFDVKQPDLNWSNTKVRHAVCDAMRFWLDLGVDGFRVDAVYWMSKDPLFRDDPLNHDYIAGEDSPYEALDHQNSQGWPAVYARLTEMASVLKEPAYQNKDRFMVTEAYPERHNPLDAYLAFYEGMDAAVAAPFNFEGVELPWKAAEWRHFLHSFHGALDMLTSHPVASYAFGNHDKPRLASRIGEAAARSAAVMLYTLPGMVFLYYGEEIGMKDVSIAPEYVQDPAAKGDPRKSQGRDPARTPMQWSGAMHAGFSDAATTWLPLSPDYKTCNVAEQTTKGTSTLSLYRTLGALRNSSDALRYGSIEIIEVGAPDVLAYIRRSGTELYMTLINFSSEPAACQLTDMTLKRVVSSDPATKLPDIIEGEVELLPHEAALFAQ